MNNNLKKLYKLMMNNSVRIIIGPMRLDKNTHTISFQVQYSTDGIWYDTEILELKINDE